MRVIGVIPARMGSSRFPGKPLAKICGRPMIEHVYRRSALSKTLDDLFVATCDTEIFESVEKFGGKSVMTDTCHERCTDRVGEAILKIPCDIVVIIQGDEPLVTPEMIDEAVTPMIADPAIQCINLLADIDSDEDFIDPNEVKVVIDCKGDALYFSREPIPSVKKGERDFPRYKQVCIMPFSRKFLFTYMALPPTPLEKIESVDMLRILEHGYKVRMIHTDARTCSVDTMEDLHYVEQAMNKDPLFCSHAY